jgi:hypothetical protein
MKERCDARGGVGKINRVVGALAGLKTLIFRRKYLLLNRVLFAGNMGGLLAGKPPPMEQIDNAADRVIYPVPLIGMSADRFGVRQNMFFQITIQLAHLPLVELGLGPGIVVFPQRRNAALPIPLEIVPRGLLVEQQNLRHLPRRPAPSQSHNRLDSVGLPPITQATMKFFQLRYFFLC